MPTLFARLSLCLSAVVALVLLLSAYPAAGALPTNTETYVLEATIPIIAGGARAAPVALAVGVDGSLHVAAARFTGPTAQDYIVRVSADGTSAVELPFSGFARDIAVDASGNLFRLLPTVLVRYNPQGQSGSVAGATFLDAHSVAVGSRGRAYVVDSDAVAIIAGLSSAGFIGGSGSEPGRLSGPRGVAVAPDGAIVVADTGNRRVQRFASDGAFLTAFQLADGAAPLRVAVGADGDIFVLTVAGFVEKYSPTGELLARWGGAFRSPQDIAVGPDGRVFVADTDNRRVQVFRRLAVGEATPTPLPTLDPNAPCLPLPDRQIIPSAIPLGQTSRVSLGVRTSCAVQTLPADITLVLDISLSMTEEGRLLIAKQAAQNFVEVLNLDQDQVALVAFSDTADLVVPLGQQRYRVQQAIAALIPQGGTDIALAITTAQAELAGARHRSGFAPVLVLLTDGWSDPEAALAAAQAARSAGTQIFAIGIGRDVRASLLQQVASGPEYYFYTRTGAELNDIYQHIARRVQETDVRDVVITETLRPDVEIAGWGQPAPDIAGRTLTWRLPALAVQGITVTYEIRPLTPGEYPPSQQPAAGSYLQSNGSRTNFAFPQRTIRVVAPTATPTPRPTVTPTPSPTPTPARYDLYLPLLRTFGEQ